MGCLPNVPPTNPISQLIVGALGENFYPPFDPNFAPPKRGQMTEEKLLKMILPGGGKLKPIGDPKHVHISEYIAPITGLLGSVFAFFGPIYIILDVIRAIIDIICSLFNPVPLILSIVDLFINVVPPLIALYPPLSSILLAINVIKVLVSIVGAIGASLVPLIKDIVEKALEVPGRLAEGDIAFVDIVEVKLCELFQEFSNIIAGFAPLKFVLELINIFMNLGAKGFCVAGTADNPGAPCCGPEECPPIIINPSYGKMVVLDTIKSFSLHDIFDKINIPLKAMSDTFNDIIGSIFDFVEDKLIGPLNGVIELMKNIVGPGIDLLSGLPISKPNLSLQIPTPDGEDVTFVHPLMTLEYKTATSGPNALGLVSQVGLGHKYSKNEIAGLQKFIVDPEKLASPLPSIPSFFGGGKQPDKAATIRVRLRDPKTNVEVVADAIFQFPTLQTIAARLRLTEADIRFLLRTARMDFIPLNYLGILQVRDDTFEKGTELEYEILPDEIELLKQELIGSGCLSEVQNAKNITNKLFDYSGGGKSLASWTGFSVITPPPEEELREELQKLIANPTEVVDPIFILNNYLDELAEIYDSILCVGANGIQSTFASSKTSVLANGKDRAILSVRIKDAGGNDLLVGGQIPGSRFRVQFNSTKGTVGPVIFDEDSGTFNAALSGEDIGDAEITASFVVREGICMNLSSFQSSPAAVTVKTIKVRFVNEKTAYPRARKQNQYVQSRGGRARR